MTESIIFHLLDFPNKMKQLKGRINWYESLQMMPTKGSLHVVLKLNMINFKRLHTMKPIFSIWQLFLSNCRSYFYSKGWFAEFYLLVWINMIGILQYQLSIWDESSVNANFASLSTSISWWICDLTASEV